MKKQLSVFLASTMIIGNIGVSTSMSYADTNDVSRISGNDRFETCVKLSEKNFKKSDMAVIASGESYPDALSNGAFATRYNVSLLLVKRDKIPKVISNGFLITNCPLIDIPVEKYWNSKPIEFMPSSLNDNVLARINDSEITNLQKSKVSIPSSIKVNLLADNKVIDILEITKENNWKGSFKKLPMYDENDGHEINYTVKEVPIKGYIAEYLQVGKLVIVNKYIILIG
ncbi:Cna B-type domain-containing protein [Eubacteriales bacterium KG127]